MRARSLSAWVVFPARLLLDQFLKTKRIGLTQLRDQASCEVVKQRVGFLRVPILDFKL